MGISRTIFSKGQIFYRELIKLQSTNDSIQNQNNIIKQIKDSSNEDKKTKNNNLILNQSKLMHIFRNKVFQVYYQRGKLKNKF